MEMGRLLVPTIDKGYWICNFGFIMQFLADMKKGRKS
jgi:hypothetical protein